MRTLATQQDARGDFQSYRRLLWSVLNGLSKRGYFVPPDEGQDVLHDFYLEAWPGLSQRFREEEGEFASYVAGAFYRFARRRVTQLNAWSRRLVALDDIPEIATDSNNPLHESERAEQLRRLKRAIDSLPGMQRSLLLEYYGANGRPSERSLASNHGMTRHAVRKALVAGLEELARKLATVSVGHSDVATFTVTAPRHHVPETIELAYLEKTMDTRSMLKDLLLTPHLDAILPKVRHLREQLEQDPLLTGQMDLTNEERIFLEHHPEHLSKVYDVLFSSDTQEQPNYDKHIEEIFAQADLNEASEIAASFTALVEDLPERMRLFHLWFEQVEVDPSYAEYLRELPVSHNTPQELRERILRLGMTAETFAAVFRGFQLLLDSRSSPDADGRLNFNERKPALIVHTERGEAVAISRDELLAQTRTTPGLVAPAKLAEGLVKWTLDALQMRPLLIAGYRFESGDVLECHPVELDYELMARWSTPTVPAEADIPRLVERPRF